MDVQQQRNLLSGHTPPSRDRRHRITHLFASRGRVVVIRRRRANRNTRFGSRPEAPRASLDGFT
jgi:hypothetical protein